MEIYLIGNEVSVLRSIRQIVLCKGRDPVMALEPLMEIYFIGNKTSVLQ